MAIPQRLRLPPAPKADIHKFSVLCGAIEDGTNRKVDVTSLLEEWNKRAHRHYEPVEFTAYYGAISTEEFVKGALMPAPRYIEDLTYAELKAVLETLMAVELAEAEHGYYLSLLDENFPDGNISDLLYWPNKWFANEDLLNIEFSADQILSYVMVKSGRKIAEAPEAVSLEYPIPE